MTERCHRTLFRITNGHGTRRRAALREVLPAKATPFLKCITSGLPSRLIRFYSEN